VQCKDRDKILWVALQSRSADGTRMMVDKVIDTKRAESTEYGLDIETQSRGL
jgi:hypothetical protein